MCDNRTRRFLSGILILLILAGCRADEPFVETFDAPGDWRTGDDADGEGAVQEGVYDLLVEVDSGIKWTTAGKDFGDGEYEVEATPVEGPRDNGYGMLLRVDDEKDNFYLFEISGDGYVWIGRWRDGEEEAALVGQDWFESDAVKQGNDVTNKLGVRAENGNMIFLVNDFEVGRVTDNAFRRGDIGLLVETFGLGGVRVHFDNFKVTPIDR